MTALGLSIALQIGAVILMSPHFISRPGAAASDAPTAFAFISDLEAAPLASAAGAEAHLAPTLEEPVFDMPPPPTLELEAREEPVERPRNESEFSPPRLDESAMAPDLAERARAAAIDPAESLRVILRIEVKEDGSVGAVQIERGSGNTRADETAVQYARELRWVPGRSAGRPVTMTIRFPVLFNVHA
jgi:TonB family protein